MVKIDEKYAISSDKYNIILLVKKNDKYKRIGFYRTIKGAIEKYIDEKIKENINKKELTKIDEIVELIKKLEENCSKKIEKLENLKTKYSN